MIAFSTWKFNRRIEEYVREAFLALSPSFRRLPGESVRMDISACANAHPAYVQVRLAAGAEYLATFKHESFARFIRNVSGMALFPWLENRQNGKWTIELLFKTITH